MMSSHGQDALRDMVELQMYLVPQPQRKPWPMMPRRAKEVVPGKKPHCNPIEASAAAELVESGFIENSSNRTYVVSKSGHEFYLRELNTVKPKAGV